MRVFSYVRSVWYVLYLSYLYNHLKQFLGFPNHTILFIGVILLSILTVQQLRNINEDMLAELTENDFKEIVLQNIAMENDTSNGLMYYPNYNRLIERDKFNLYSRRTGIIFAFPNNLLAKFFDLDIKSFREPVGFLDITIDLTDDNVVCFFPLDIDFKYVSFYQNIVANTKRFYNDYFLSYEKKAITYKTFVRLLLAISQQESLDKYIINDDSHLTNDIQKLNKMTDFVHLDGLYKSVDSSTSLINFNTLPFTYFIKQVDSTHTMYRLKFGSDTNPSFRFKYRVNDEEGFGYRLTGIYFMDVLFNGNLVENIKCYKYNGVLSIFNNTVHENLLEEVPLFSKYLTGKYKQLSHKELLSKDIVTDLRENVLTDLNDTTEGRSLYEHLLTNMDF